MVIRRALTSHQSSLFFFQEGTYGCQEYHCHHSVPQDTWEFSESRGIHRFTGLSTVRCRADIFKFFLMTHQSNELPLLGMYPITHKNSQMGPTGASIPPSPKGRMKNGGEQQVQCKKAPYLERWQVFWPTLSPTHPFPSDVFPCLKLSTFKQTNKKSTKHKQN